MTKARALILPFYLFLCLVLGGSTQKPWPNAVLQLLAVAIISWAILTREPQPLAPAARRLLHFVGALAILFLIQLVPLPPAVWQALPGRQFVADGFDLLGMAPPWLPLSLAPHDTLAAATRLLPPLALLIGMLRLRAWTVEAMFASILLGTFVSIVLGILQVGGDQSWYFYPRTNLGLAVGTFANANHYGSLLLVAMPVLAALVSSRWRSARGQQQRTFAGAIALGAGAVLAAGFLMSRSLAVLLIGPPVVIATAALVLRLPKRVRLQALAAVGILVAVAAVSLPIFAKDLPSWGTSASVETRIGYWSRSLGIIGDQGATGSGIGTFAAIYPHYEDPEMVEEFYANHAHNDYVEIGVEAGLPGLLLLVWFLGWWFGRVRAAWAANGMVEQKAAAIASAALLMHSIFDFPLRMPALASAFAVFLALLAGARGAVSKAGSGEDEQVRHATL